MDLLLFLVFSALVLSLAYRVVGRKLAAIFNLSTAEDTPAHQLRDGLDFEPARASYLLPQHFSAIAAAGPIVGPILAGLYFGWGPAWLWIILGSILIGGIHDFTALVASVRHRARSIAQVVREHMNPRAHLLFLIFIWFALIYVIIAFTDVTAGTFVVPSSAATADAPGPAVATSSVLYLLLAVAMGLALRFTSLSPVRAKLIFLPLVFVSIVLGPYLPIDLGSLLPGVNPQVVWGYVLLAYCFLAALAPVWALLQPRGELGGYFLYIVMGAGVLGIAIGAFSGDLHIQQPFFKGWEATDSFGNAAPLFPILFITVACGACSGFHSVVASGTTSKQLRCELDARSVGYGSMLLEAFFACLSLATLMILTQPSGGPSAIYAKGIANFADHALSPLLPAGVEIRALLYQFALLCFATFVFDTLDACTRLARYVLMELLSWSSRPQAILATALTLVLPALALAIPRIEFAGKPLPLYQVFWGIFGSSNQLLAALTLLGITVWLARKGQPYWLALGPTLFMMAMTLWSLLISIGPYMSLWQSGASIEPLHHFQFLITLSLIVLSLWLIVEAFLTWRTFIRPPQGRAEPALA
ncbi:MAG: carbon starvation protein A [Candidatus Latescibacteria bacterium]|nr:carbon starvation protein A [Candidatus Latescibacterota bacterium]